jgi:hypothetical protein
LVSKVPFNDIFDILYIIQCQIRNVLFLEQVGELTDGCTQLLSEKQFNMVLMKGAKETAAANTLLYNFIWFSCYPLPPFFLQPEVSLQDLLQDGP